MALSVKVGEDAWWSSFSYLSSTGNQDVDYQAASFPPLPRYAIENRLFFSTSVFSKRKGINADIIYVMYIIFYFRSISLTDLSFAAYGMALVFLYFRLRLENVFFRVQSSVLPKRFAEYIGGNSDILSNFSNLSRSLAVWLAALKPRYCKNQNWQFLYFGANNPK